MAALLGGLGVLAYLACWLIIPQEGEQPGDPASGWIVILAEACAVCVGIAILAAAAAAATLFGFGWLVMALAVVVLAGVLSAWPRFGPGWALLPVAALILPSVAIAGSGLRVAPRAGDLTVSPAVLTVNSDPTYSGGLGTMLIDLRRTALPASGVVHLRIEGGLRRTIVALPADRCVHVALRFEIRPFVARLAAQLTGRSSPYSGAVVFGDPLIHRAGAWEYLSTTPGPVLSIDFTSAGGSLYVRDYPVSTDPDLLPYWPGYRVVPEPRPDTTGVPKRAARRLVRAWRVRLKAELRSERLIDSLMPGPCVAGS